MTHHPLVILDAHQDIGYNRFRHGRDYRSAALKIRQIEPQTDENIRRRGIASNGLPDALIGRVAVIFATLYILPAWYKGASPEFSYRDAAEAEMHVMRQVDYYHRLADEDARIMLIKHHSDLDTVLATWADDKTLKDRKVGLVLTMEGADPIAEPQRAEEWYERGVRSIGLAWSETRYAGGTGRPGPLTDLGRELLDVMADLNMMLDVSHMTDEGILEALDRYAGTVIASHSNPRHFVDSDRQLSDVVIDRLAERDGVIGVVAFNKFIKEGWALGDRPDSVTLDNMLGIIDYICQRTGSARHVGIGSDIDGGFGAESIPEGLDTTTDLWKFKDLLATRLGYDETAIYDILCGNFLRQLRQVLP